MRLDTWLDRRRGSAASLGLLAVLFLGCAAARNPALDRARNAYERARQDPDVAGRAAVALDQTRLTLEKAERLWETEKDVAEVEHLVYLTEKRAEIARVTAKRRLAADEIQQLMPKRD